MLMASNARHTYAHEINNNMNEQNLLGATKAMFKCGYG